MADYVTESGLVVTDHRHDRALRPPRDNPPNEAGAGPNDPPVSVGPTSSEGFGNTHVMYPARFPPPQAQAWSGWPVEWATPTWSSFVGQFSTQVDTVFAALDYNSSVLSTMPPYRTRGSVVIDPPSWLANPCPAVYTSWEEFAEQVFWSYHLGEAFVYALTRDSTDHPSQMVMLEPWQVGVDLIGGVREYRVNGEPVDRRDMLHIRYKSWPNEPRGHGPLESAGARLVAAAALIRYASDLAARGGIPWAVIKHPDELTATQASWLQQQWLASRLNALGLPAVMSGGVDIEALQVSPKDMSLQDMQTFNESRLSILLGVLPSLIGLPSGQESMTYQTLEGIYEAHWRAFLNPRATKVMKALSWWALPRGQAIELNRDEYVRPPFNERAAGYASLHTIEDETGRAITAIEVRELERLTSQSAPLSLSGGGRG